MNIDLLSKMVRELLLDNDTVTLPGLGSFVAEMVPAAFSDKGFTINPPYRKLYFRENLEADDRLAELYASSNGVSKEVAAEALEGFVGEVRDLLNSRKSVVFQGLGRLRATKENNYFFVPFENMDIYPEGIGLEPVSLKVHETPQLEPVEVVAPIEVAEAPVEPVEPVETPVKSASVSEPVEPVEAPVEPVETVEPAVEPVETESVDSAVVTEKETSDSAAAVAATVTAAASVASASWTMTDMVEPAEEPAASGESSVGEAPAQGPSDESAGAAAVEVFEVKSPEPAAEQQTEPEQIVEALVEQQTEPEQVTEQPEKVQVKPEDRKKGGLSHGWKVTLLVAGIILCVVIILFLIFLIVAHVRPDLVDPLLYTKEELEILNYPLP